MGHRRPLLIGRSCPILSGHFCPLRGSGAEIGISGQGKNVVDVGLSEAATLPGNQPVGFELVERPTDRSVSRMQVFGETLLAGKAASLLPGVVKEQGIDDLGLVAQAVGAEDWPRQLGEPMLEVLVDDFDGVAGY